MTKASKSGIILKITSTGGSSRHNNQMNKSGKHYTGGFIPSNTTTGIAENTDQRATIEAMNSIDGKYLKTIKAVELVPGKLYDCRVIKRIESRDFGVNYLLRSNDFQMYLPKRFSQLNIEENVVGRKFRIRGFMSNQRFPNKRSPLIEFLLVDEESQSAGETEGNNETRDEAQSCPIESENSSTSSSLSARDEMEIVEEEEDISTDL